MCLSYHRNWLQAYKSRACWTKFNGPIEAEMVHGNRIYATEKVWLSKNKEKEVTFKLNFISCATFFLDTYLASFVVYELSAHIIFNSFGVE